MKLPATTRTAAELRPRKDKRGVGLISTTLVQLMQRHAVRQLLAKAMAADDEIMDAFPAAGLKQLDTSTLSDQVLAEVRGLKYRNVAAELRTEQ